MLPKSEQRDRDLGQLRRRIDSVRAEIYASLTPWQRVQLARHPGRPCMLDYVSRLFTEFTEVHGDRRFADDHAIVAGMACFHGEPVLVVGHQKGGADTKQKIYRNFGYARPEGYRKALRAMKMAEKFGRPILVIVDTPAAYPGIESEERGVAEAIAYNLREMSVLSVPVIVAICGEGGSGGARRLRGDPVAGRGAEGRSGGGLAADGARHGEAGHRGCDRARARRRRAQRPGCGGRAARSGDDGRAARGCGRDG
jgi:acetyl-CoA carboxylase carboxyl transferase subunit alpha